MPEPVQIGHYLPLGTFACPTASDLRVERGYYTYKNIGEQYVAVKLISGRLNGTWSALSTNFNLTAKRLSDPNDLRYIYCNVTWGRCFWNVVRNRRQHIHKMAPEGTIS